MDCAGGIYSFMHLGNARSARQGERCGASLGRNDYRAEFGRAISLVQEASRELVVLDRSRCDLHSALRQSPASTHRSALRGFPGDVPCGNPGMVAQSEERSVGAMKHGLGLVIGKFCPPHRGHKLLIDAATHQSERTVVILCAKPTDTIPGELRGRWLREIHPTVEVMVIDDRYDKNDSRIWADNTVRWVGRAPDAVFTSEDYGDRYAELMGSKHVLVDKPRERVPISGTAMRNDPYANWGFIEPPVRAWFAKRVCVVGAESTGTTTLAKTLAGLLQTAWVDEYGREYSEIKLARNDPDWRSEEFTAIAEEQTRREDDAARRSNRVLICDTNAFVTVLWHRRYIDRKSTRLNSSH